jgi:hypothetical protein
MGTETNSPHNGSRRNACGTVLRELGVVGLSLLAVKLVWLALDHTLRLYMGDSMVFMDAGAHSSMVGVRSYPYGWALHLTVYRLHSPLAIIVLQALWASLSALGLFAFLRYALRLRFAVCLVAAVLLATEPAQIFLERMVMAEAFGLLALVSTVLVYSRYLATGRFGWYLLGTLAGLAAAAIRTNFLPLVIGLGILLPFVHVLAGKGRSTTGTVRLRHVVLALAVLATSHLAYVSAYGRATGQPSGYLVHTGMMRIGLVAPLVRAEHFEGTGVPGDVLRQVKLPLRDHWQRGNHIWDPDGLWRVLERNSDNPEMVARTITRRAMLDDPLGLLRINIETLGGYFNRKQVYWRMLDDKGVIAPTKRDLRLIREWMGWDAAGINKRETPARLYFAASGPWLTFCLFALAPLGLLSLRLGWNSGRREQYWLLALVSWGLFASHLLFSHIVSFRYLHPFPWFVLANLAVVASVMLERRRGAARMVPGEGRAPQRVPSLE